MNKNSVSFKNNLPDTVSVVCCIILAAVLCHLLDVFILLDPPESSRRRKVCVTTLAAHTVAALATITASRTEPGRTRGSLPKTNLSWT